MSRYEDKTQENILNDSLAKANNLMSELPEEERVSMDEGSLIYLALSKNALRLEEAYAELDALNDNLLVDTQDEEHLIETGAEAGLPIISGTPANVRAELNCEAEEGTEFSAVDSDYNYILTEFIETIIDGENTRYAYVLEAMEDGGAPGNYRGDIEPVDFLDGFDTGEIVSTIDPGTEQEDIEVYRQRRLNNFVTKECAGNAAYYVGETKKIPGVGGVKAVRRQEGTDYIPVYVQASDYGVPSSNLINTIQATFTPNEPGDGTGRAPFGQNPRIIAVEAKECDIVVDLEFEEGYSWAAMYSTIRAAVEEYFLSLRETWETSTIIVRVSYIENAILNLDHVTDVSSVTINGSSANVTCGAYEIPTLGTLEEA